MCPDDNHPHIIDLGLPSGTKWACCNVGASKPDGYGGYYAWGETSKKNSYGVPEYKYCDDYGMEWSNIGTDIAGTSYDAATVNWKAPWQMPTLAQCQELIYYTSSKWTILNGVCGKQFRGSNGNAIFLPAAGTHVGDNKPVLNEYGYYWSSTFVDDNDWGAYAHFLIFQSNSESTGSDFRSDGMSVRPVQKN